MGWHRNCPCDALNIRGREGGEGACRNSIGGTVLFVGYHMLLGIELIPLVDQLMIERNILVPGISHPAMLVRIKDKSPVGSGDIGF